MNFIRPSGSSVVIESKRRSARLTAGHAVWRRAYLWSYLVDVGVPDPVTRRPRPMTRVEIATMFGVSRPLVSRWVSAVRKALIEAERMSQQ